MSLIERLTLYSASEIELIRRQMRLANLEARKAAQAAGFTLHPRIAALKARERSRQPTPSEER